MTPNYRSTFFFCGVSVCLLVFLFLSELRFPARIFVCLSVSLFAAHVLLNVCLSMYALDLLIFLYWSTCHLLHN
jgi:hypothetical protein